MGSIMKIQLLNDRFTFKELKNDEKIYVEAFVFLLLHVYRGHLSPPVRILCHVLDVPLMGENIIFFVKKNVLKCSYSKIYT